MGPKEAGVEGGGGEEVAEGSAEAAAAPRAEEEVAKAAGVVKMEMVEELTAVVGRSGCPNAN